MELDKTSSKRPSSAVLSAPDAAVIRCEGEMGEMELSHIGEELFRLTHQGRRRVVLDLTAVDHVDYRGLKPLAARARLLRTSGGDLRLAGLSPYLCAIFRAAGLEDEFETHPTAQDALWAFAREPSLARARV